MTMCNCTRIGKTWACQIEDLPYWFECAKEAEEIGADWRMQQEQEEQQQQEEGK